MASTALSIAEICQTARRASRALATLGSGVKDDALEAMAAALEESTEEILEANARDLEAGEENGLSPALLDRLALDPGRIAGMAAGVRKIAALPDPVGEVIDGSTLPNGLQMRRVRVPLGVIAVVYEARPNVTIDAAALCLKSGNAVVLRGSSSAAHSNAVLAAVASDAATAAGLPPGAMSLVAGGGREELAELATQAGVVDLIIPRGGEGLKAALKGVATVPVIYAASGNNHVYVDAGADLDAARAIVLNAKLQRPGTCNAAEKLLVHAGVADQFLPDVLSALDDAGVTLHGDERVAPCRARLRRSTPPPTRTGTPSTSRWSWRSPSSTPPRTRSPMSTPTAAATRRRSSRRIDGRRAGLPARRRRRLRLRQRVDALHRRRRVRDGRRDRQLDAEAARPRARSGCASCARSSTWSRAPGTSAPDPARPPAAAPPRRRCASGSSAEPSTRHISVTSSAPRRHTVSSSSTR